ncbi:MAG: PrsW family intramembrane metalloprotease [Anaerolineaceae bacterium]|nr:PrsW family intramembrane metalloprotease [Anaerolineaceae bacterium]
MSDKSGDKANLFAARNLIFSILGLVGAVSVIGLFVLSLLINQLADSANSVLTETYNLVWFLAFFGLMLVPFLIIAIYQIGDKTPPAWLRIPRLQLRQYVIALVSWVVILLVSYLFGLGDSFFWLFSPPLKILAVFIPLALIILYLADTFKLRDASRNWGMVSFSVVLTEPITIFMEIFVVMIFLIAVGVSGDWSQVLGNEAFVYLSRLTYGMNNPDILSRIFLPFLSQPVILFIIFALFSVIIPMFEELMKPLALWFVSKQNLSARDGFYYGAVTGMIFALIESILGLTSFGMDSWVSVSIVRLGTGVLHIFTAALMGWALTSSWRKEKFGKLILTYIICIVIHGAWNFLAIATSINELISAETLAMHDVIQVVFPILLVLMAGGMLIAMWMISKRLMSNEETSQLTV